MCSMSADDSQNNSAWNYDDQYDDVDISESGGLSPGHSDDVQAVDARPVGGRPAKARPTAPIHSTPSKAPPKKMGKVHKGEGTSSRPKGKSTSKPNTTGGNDVELNADDTPIEITVREEEKALADGVEDYEQVCALLPEQIPPPGLEPFSDPARCKTTDSESGLPFSVQLEQLASSAERTLGRWWQWKLSRWNGGVIALGQHKQIDGIRPLFSTSSSTSWVASSPTSRRSEATVGTSPLSPASGWWQKRP
nr:hypothetical protein Iba_chr09dCG12280 [Ipomoea batatas]